jgi:hypothetical protein
MQQNINNGKEAVIIELKAMAGNLHKGPRKAMKIWTGHLPKVI